MIQSNGFTMKKQTIGDSVTDKERIEALETKVFELSQLVYALGAASPYFPVELRNQFRHKHDVKKLENDLTSG